VATIGKEQVERTRRTPEVKHWQDRCFWPDTTG
jgi:hypothetical protein